MTDIFDNWRLERELSSMQRLIAENERLRKAKRMQAVVFWSCLAGVTFLALAKLGRYL